MNEKKFLREIKSKKNRSGDILGENTSIIVMDFLSQNSLIKPSLVQQLFSRILKKDTQVKTPKQIVSENFEEIIGTFRKISEVERLDMDRVLEFCDVLLKREDVKEFGKDIVFDNIDKIYEMVEDGGDIFRIVQFEKSLGREISDDKERMLKERKLEIAEYMLNTGPLNNNYNSVEKRTEYAATLSIMIDELLQSEGCRYADIYSHQHGGFSQVYQIGDKVLKIGIPRETYNMPNHKRLLQPLIRTNFIDEEQNRPIACVEIQDKVSLSDNITKEELYGIYKELRESGIMWTDAKPPQVGRLISNNVPSLNGEDMYVDPNSVGFTNGKNEDELSAGEWVIIDTDFMYREGDCHISWALDSFSNEFERMYQSEKAELVTEDYISRYHGKNNSKDMIKGNIDTEPVK